MEQCGHDHCADTEHEEKDGICVVTTPADIQVYDGHRCRDTRCQSPEIGCSESDFIWSEDEPYTDERHGNHCKRNGIPLTAQDGPA